MRKSTVFVCLLLTLSSGLVAAEASTADPPRLDLGHEQNLVAAGKILQKAPRLVLDRRESGVIEGSYRIDGRQLRFEGRRLGEEEAEVRIWSEDGTFEIESVLQSRREGWIRAGGVQIAGRGAVGEDAQRRAQQLAESAFGKDLACLSLEIGCRATGPDEAPLLAAFVQPWQVLFKLTGRLVTDEEILRLAIGVAVEAARAGTQPSASTSAHWRGTQHLQVQVRP